KIITIPTINVINKAFVTNTGEVYVFSQEINQNSNAFDIRCDKLKSDGSIEWTKNYGSENTDMINDIILTTDQSFVLTYNYGWKNNSVFTEILKTIKIDFDGNVLWSNEASIPQTSLYKARLFEQNNNSILIISD